MRNGTPGFQGLRLVEAREARQLTQTALAELIGRKSSTVSRWESGAQSPEPDALQKLAEKVELPVSFFMRPLADHGSAGIYARSQASTTQMARKRARARLRWTQDISLALQEWVDLPPVNFPDLKATDCREIRDEEIERKAVECRRHWGLGNAPISDLLCVIENAGGVVVQDRVDSSKLDGLSQWSCADQRPYVLIASDKATCVRSRFDAAHELGHVVLHKHLSAEAQRDSASFKEIERQAFLFAGAFLLPSEGFASELWSPSLNSFLALKERWKVSIAAMIMRCSTLEIVRDEYEKRLWKSYSARGWRNHEPLDEQLPLEKTRLLPRSVRLLLDEGARSRQDLLEDFRLAAHDVEALCGLPEGFMIRDHVDAEVVQLPRLKTSNVKERVTEQPGKVLSFPPRPVERS